jgi:hypothetical protein
MESLALENGDAVTCNLPPFSLDSLELGRLQVLDQKQQFYYYYYYFNNSIVELNLVWKYQELSGQLHDSWQKKNYFLNFRVFDMFHLNFKFFKNFVSLFFFFFLIIKYYVNSLFK